MKLEDHFKIKREKELEIQEQKKQRKEKEFEELKEKLLASLNWIYSDTMKMIEESEQFNYVIKEDELEYTYFYVTYKNKECKFNIGMQEVESQIYLSRDGKKTYFLWEGTLTPMSEKRFLERIYEELYKEENI